MYTCDSIHCGECFRVKWRGLFKCSKVENENDFHTRNRKINISVLSLKSSVKIIERRSYQPTGQRVEYFN